MILHKKKTFETFSKEQYNSVNWSFFHDSNESVIQPCVPRYERDKPTYYIKYIRYLAIIWTNLNDDVVFKNTYELNLRIKNVTGHSIVLEWAGDLECKYLIFEMFIYKLVINH